MSQHDNENAMQESTMVGWEETTRTHADVIANLQALCPDGVYEPPDRTGWEHQIQAWTEVGDAADEDGKLDFDLAADILLANDRIWEDTE